jgi:iron uptake system component EfeO
VQGFHRIESILFRDGTTDSAARYSTDLVRLWSELQAALAEPSNFNFCSWWGGVIGLATEVSAKKISSEEETFSDESILIFANNFIGIREAAMPFVKVVEDASVAEAVLKALNASDASVAPFVYTGEFLHLLRCTGKKLVTAIAFGRLKMLSREASHKGDYVCYMKHGMCTM